MNDNSLNPKYLKSMINISFVLAIMSIAVMIYNAMQYLDFEGLLNKPEIYGMVVALNAMFIFFTQLFFLLTLIVIIRHIRHMRLLNMGMLVLGILSFTAVFGHWGCLSDIAKELPAGFDVQVEIWGIVLAMVLHFAFFISFLIFLQSVKKYIVSHELVRSTLTSENLYMIMHIVGMLCACMGLFYTASEFTLGITPDVRKWFVLPFMIVISLPYLIVAASWLYHVIKSKRSGNLDEKQQRDLGRAGLTTWLVSIPVMVLLFILNYHQLTGVVCIMWLPVYVYSTLLVFSISNLIYYRY